MNEVILEAVEIIKKSFGGTEVEILDTEMTRKYPDSFRPLGYLGVSISVSCGIKPHKVFLQHQIAEDMIIYGVSIAENFIFPIIKDDIPLLQKRIDKHLKNVERRKKLTNLHKAND